MYKSCTKCREYGNLKRKFPQNDVNGEDLLKEAKD